MILFVSFLCLLSLIYGYVDLHSGLKKIKNLKSIKQEEVAHEKVSIILTAKDEEKYIQLAVDKILSQNYKNKEIIIVDDRSKDNTTNILKSLEKKHQCIKLKTIEHLPKGWLGKNHAMYEGAKLASSPWLIFLDADVLLEKNTISLAMNYAAHSGVTHLTLIPEFKTKSFWLDMIICSGSLAFYFKLKPWRASQPSKNFYFGIGAFNLLRKYDYFSFGGHSSFPMCILDDMKLAKQLKLNNVKQQCLDGRGLILINWYESIKDIIVGTEKNCFAYCKFNIFNLFKESIIGIYLFIWPIIGMFMGGYYVMLINLLSLFVTVMTYASYCHLINISRLHKFAYPFGVIMGTYAWWRAAFKITYHGGLSWRNTFYSLTDLKEDIL